MQRALTSILIFRRGSYEERNCPSNLGTIRIPKPIFSHLAFYLPLCSSLLKNGSHWVSLKHWCIPSHNFTNSSINPESSTVVEFLIQISWVLGSLTPSTSAQLYLHTISHQSLCQPHFSKLASATRCTDLGCGLALGPGDTSASHLHPVAFQGPASHDSANTFSVQCLYCAFIIFLQTALEKVTSLSVGSEISGRSGFQHLGRSLACFPPKVLLSSLRSGNEPNLYNSHEGLIFSIAKTKQPVPASWNRRVLAQLWLRERQV